MALVKKKAVSGGSITGNGSADEAAGASATTAASPPIGTPVDRGAALSAAAERRGGEVQRRKIRVEARRRKLAEGIGAAATELAGGVVEVTAAAGELRKAIEQIASGADEASSATQQSQRMIHRATELIGKSRRSAEGSLSKVNGLQTLMKDLSAQILASVDEITRGAFRQEGAVGVVRDLEFAATEIGAIVVSVAGIADQTNLLALNAAIEAARAGEAGRGFAVVADEVQTLADRSERSAHDIQQMVGEIQQSVALVVDGMNTAAIANKAEVERGRNVVAQLERMHRDMQAIALGAQETIAASIEADVAARETQRGAETIAAAAEEQSAAAEEAQKTVRQQAQSLMQSEQTAARLSEVALELNGSTDVRHAAEELASAAEQLSAAIEEINRAAAQIMITIDQISRGAYAQGAATGQSSTAIAQIEASARLSAGRAAEANRGCVALAGLLLETRGVLTALSAGIARSASSGRTCLDHIDALSKVGHKIGKIVDSIGTVAIQTSMLAVSGSIEAARSGESGRGFTVVSTDIRNLARDSLDNVDRVKDIVQAIQMQTIKVRRDIEDSAIAAEQEVSRLLESADALSTVTQELNAVTNGSREIMETAEDVQEAVAETMMGVEQIAVAANHTNRAATEAVKAAREQAKGAEDLAAAIEEIAAMADELQTGA